MFRATRCTSSLASVRSSMKQGIRPAQQLRTFSSRTTAQASANLSLYLSLGGLAGMGAWYAMGGFQGDIRSKLQQIHADSGSDVALSNEEFRPLKLKEVRPYNHDSSFYVFELPDNKQSGMFTASALVIRGAEEEPKGKDGKSAIRPYTPVNPPSDKGELVLLVKHYPQGTMTQHLKSLKVGDVVRFKGPIPKHPYKANEFEEIGMIAAGSGITPMWQLIQEISSNPGDKTKVTLLYGNKTEADILLREKFDALKNDSRFNIVYFLDEVPKGLQAEKGYVGKEAIQKYLPGSEKGTKAKIFVCGPPPMVKALAGPKDGPKQGDLQGVLSELGFKAEQVFKF
ncbi:cytochrome-b5 reductase [Malassezia caprae]|uniref:NADH-cytochrome b5 reductase n=1 Tax=Malassezia caprae TaxID=1381934 RepID=A0AAF0EAJ5_9BASI|nr:cytochrome-b5 reductase [Malassezia caprae]